MDTNYIYRLLQDHSRVILPNFGAFLIKDKVKINSSDNNQNITISFNDFLKFNDGILIDYVAQKDKTDKLQAANIVNEFISEIKIQLEKNGEFIIEGVGKLFNENNTIKFSQQLNIKKVSKESSKAKQKTVVINAEEPITKVEKVIEEPKKIVIEPTSSNKTIEKLPLAEKPKTPYAKAATPIKHTETTTTNEDNSSIKWKWIFSAILLIAIVIAGLYLSGYFDNSGKVKNSNIATTTENNSSKNTTSQPDIIVADSNNTSDNAVVTEDSLTKDSLEKANINEVENEANKSVEEIPEKIIEPETSKFYHLIAASCDSKKSADKYVNKLKAQGYESQIINKKNGYFRVSYGSYSSKKEALEALDLLKDNNKKAWYLYYEN